MKNLIKATLSAAALAVILPGLSFAQAKSIYGPDNRVDYVDASKEMKALSDSVVSLWDAGSLTTLDTGKYAKKPKVKLTTEKFGEALSLCKGEKFWSQPIGAFCTGSLVGEDMIMTAGHCLKEDTINPTKGKYCADMRFIFGFAVKKAGKAPAQVPASEVYSCKKSILHVFAGGKGQDYALIQLDRKVTGHKILEISRKDIAKDTKIVVSGHPVGLPLKVADGAKVRDASPANYFVTDLDTFGGNSGSPVFNAETKLIEGILVRGDTDFIMGDAGCRTSATYTQEEGVGGGRGEDVTKVSLLASSIPTAKERELQQCLPDEAVGVNSSDLPQLMMNDGKQSVSFE